jgi:hypothetical protein
MIAIYSHIISLALVIAAIISLTNPQTEDEDRDFILALGFVVLKIWLIICISFADVEL